MDIKEKYKRLEQYIKGLKSLAVAFSGGVDSTFLLAVAHEILGDRVVAVTVKSPFFPEREFREAGEFVQKKGIRQILISINELEVEEFLQNSADRCYFCKKDIFSKIINEAGKLGINKIADGSNIDDLADYRPGMKAVKELQIISPLKEAQLSKEEIRILSREMELPSWDKPAFACLASRIPYGHKITEKKLKMVERSEQYLMDLGFRQVRVRHHDEVARIEVPSDDRIKFFDLATMDMVQEKLKNIGFTYIALDLKGYRMGSLNETIKNC